jgi:hypothetical protein
MPAKLTLAEQQEAIDDPNTKTDILGEMFEFPSNISKTPTWVSYQIFAHQPKKSGGKGLNGMKFGVGVLKTALVHIALSSDAPVITTENQGWKQESAGDILEQMGSEALVAISSGQVGSGIANIAKTLINVPGQELKKFTAQQEGTAMVEKMALKYDGPEGLRSFTMTHIFVPRNREESEMVKKIIMQFRAHSAPELAGGAGPGIYNSYQFPSLFTITQMKGKHINPAYPKFQTCYCKSVTSKFGDATNNTFAGSGMPTTMEISLQFEEIGIINRQLITHGGY